MATKLAIVANLCKNHRVSTLLQSKNRPVINSVRCLSERSTTIVGLIPPEPLKSRASWYKVLLCISGGVYIGQLMAKRFAAFLEETEMFVPEDDDD